MPITLLFFFKKKKNEAQVEIIFVSIHILAFQFTLNLQPIICNLIWSTKSTERNQIDWIQWFS